MLLPRVVGHSCCEAGSGISLTGSFVALNHLTMITHGGLSLIKRILREARIRLYAGLNVFLREVLLVRLTNGVVCVAS